MYEQLPNTTSNLWYSALYMLMYPSPRNFPSSIPLRHHDIFTFTRPHLNTLPTDENNFRQPYRKSTWAHRPRKPPKQLQEQPDDLTHNESHQPLRAPMHPPSAHHPDANPVPVLQVQPSIPNREPVVPGTKVHLTPFLTRLSLCFSHPIAAHK